MEALFYQILKDLLSKSAAKLTSTNVNIFIGGSDNELMGI